MREGMPSSLNAGAGGGKTWRKFSRDAEALRVERGACKAQPFRQRRWACARAPLRKASASRLNEGHFTFPFTVSWTNRSFSMAGSDSTNG